MQPTTTNPFVFPEPPKCRCNQTGYCPRHGTYEPAVRDPEVLSAIYPSHIPANGRVIRKPLEK